MFSKLTPFLLLLGYGLSVGSAIISAVSTNINDVKFFYYWTPTQYVEIRYGGPTPYIRPGPTVILIDGFLSNVTSHMSQTLKNSESLRGTNVIIVDWGRLSGSGIPLGNFFLTAFTYTRALLNVGPAGSRVADFIRRHLPVHPSQVHIIGHSLGAHVSGAAGTFYRQRYRQRLGRITGLDPAGPFFNLQSNPGYRLDKGDAAFVDIYHTNRGNLGDSRVATGNINVFVNGGSIQPGCTPRAGYCSHSYGWKFYDVSIYQNVIACPCRGRSCQCRWNCKRECINPIVIGDRVPLNAYGAYHAILNDPLLQYAG